jgi:NADPH:quinone reductase-like Zn-dependent oxidoreductase
MLLRVITICRSHLLVTGSSGGVGSSAVLLAKAMGCRFELLVATCD